MRGHRWQYRLTERYSGLLKIKWIVRVRVGDAGTGSSPFVQDFAESVGVTVEMPVGGGFLYQFRRGFGVI
jgi:hypothetical protein